MKKGIWFVVAGSVITLGALCFFSYQKTDKTAYVNIATIYNAYPLKIELENKLELSQSNRSRLLDSLMNDLEFLSLKVKENHKNEELRVKFFEKRNDFERFRNEMEEQAGAEAEAYKDQIWRQLNAYIRQYGKDAGYDYIFSSEDSYHVLYYNETKDITEELNQYLLEKYKGK